MISLFIRNAFFTVLQPGLVAGLVPYWILNGTIDRIYEQTWEGQQIIAFVIFTLGLIIMLWCIASFAIKGKGTLSPADPTKKLVIIGLYKFSRNPMYVGVLLILIGEAIFFNSLELGIYTLFVGVTFDIFIRFIEEPRLKRDFGQAYIQYCKKVGRWI